MKPVNSWTEEEAQEAREYLLDPANQNPVFQQALADYDTLVAKREAAKAESSHTPQHLPMGAQGLRLLMPLSMGGEARVFEEPDKESFLKSHPVAPGEDPEMAYRDFADDEWMKALLHSKQMGLPISRKKPEPELVDPAELATPEELVKAGDIPDSAQRAMVPPPTTKQLVGTGLSALSGYTLPGADVALANGARAVGADKVADYLKSSTESVSPEARAIAEGSASLLPGALIGKAFGGLRGLMGPSTSFLGGALKGAAAGAGTGAAAGATRDVLENIGAPVENPTFAQNAEGDMVPQSTTKDVLADMALKTPGRALIGALFGLVPGAASGVRAMNRNPMDPLAREFMAVENAGGRGAVFGQGGVKMPPSVASKVPGPGENPVDLVVEDAAKKIAESIAKRAVGPLEAPNNTMNVSAADLEAASGEMDPDIAAMARAFRERVNAGKLVGENTAADLNAARHPLDPGQTFPENINAHMIRHAEGNPTIADPGQANTNIHVSSPRGPNIAMAGRVGRYQGKEAAYEEALANADIVGQKGDTVRELPRQNQARGNALGKKPTPVETADTAPSVRTPPSMDHMEELSRRLKDAGIKAFDVDPENPELLADIQKALHKAGFGEGTTPHNRALAALVADDPVAAKALADVYAIKVQQSGRLGHVPSIGLNPMQTARNVSSAAKFRADPVAGVLSKLAPFTSSVAGSHAVDPLTQALLDLAMKTKTQHQVRP